MSIIYEALKKVEKSGGLAIGAKISRPVVRRRVFLNYILAAAVALFLVRFSWWGITEFIASKPPVNGGKSLAVLSPASEEAQKAAALEALAALEENMAAPTEEHPSFVLNGIFFSEDGGYALINNQVIREGDLIDGALVKNISRDCVELDSQGEVIKIYNR